MFVTETSAIVTNLKRGTRYTFELSARNAVGLSPSVSGRRSTTLKPVSRPDVPTAPLNAEVTNVAHTELTVAWQAPASDGGSPITGYLVDWGSGSDITTGTTFTIDGLNPATRVTVNISAINVFGPSPATTVTATTPIKPVPRPTVPTAPQNLVTTSLNEYIVVTFDAPQSDGGAAISYYEATDETGRSTQVEPTPAGALRAIMGPYGSGEIHDIDIRAVNSMGAGPAASIQGRTNLVPVPAPTVPDIPENLEVVNTENDSVSLVWDAPEDTGGTRITGYQITWGTSESLMVPVPSVVIEGLEAGTFYTVEIRAINQIGIGAPASVQVLTNMAPVPIPERPSVPRDVRVTGVTGTSIAVDWEVPASDGGTPITGYEVSIGGGTGQGAGAAAATGRGAGAAARKAD
jgi:titin